MSFSPDGKTLAAVLTDHQTLECRDREGNAPARGFLALHSVRFSPDGTTLASGSTNKTIKLWNVATGEKLRTLTGHHDSVFSVSFSPDGKTLASGSHDKTIKLWNVATDQGNPPSRGMNGVFMCQFQPDGKTLASGIVLTRPSNSGIRDRRELRTLRGMMWTWSLVSVLAPMVRPWRP